MSHPDEDVCGLAPTCRSAVIVGDLRSMWKEKVLHPVTGTAGNLLPGLFVHIINILVYAENLAAVHAAKSYSPSANMQFYVPAA